MASTIILRTVWPHNKAEHRFPSRQILISNPKLKRVGKAQIWIWILKRLQLLIQKRLCVYNETVLIRTSNPFLRVKDRPSDWKLRAKIVKTVWILLRAASSRRANFLFRNKYQWAVRWRIISEKFSKKWCWATGEADKKQLTRFSA